MNKQLFQALHSPVGANASFALGYGNHGGGFGIEEERLREQDVFIGIRDRNKICCLPFLKDAESSQIQSFVKKEGEENSHQLTVFAEEEVKREFGYGSDLFQADTLSFELFSPVRKLPNPGTAGRKRCKDAFIPAILAKITIDNREKAYDVDGIFAVSPMKGKTTISTVTGGDFKGFLSTEHYGFATEGSHDVEEFCDFGLVRAYERPKKVPFLIAPLAGLIFHVPAGEKREWYISLGWFHGGIVTAGSHECSYYYTKFFTNLLDVLSYTLERTKDWVVESAENNQFIKEMHLEKEREFLIIQSIKSYYVSTMLFDDGGIPRWVVNEGSFRMMNTFDLTIDHAFFELQYQPWAVKNQLDSYFNEYSYYDQCGIAFTHDQGTHHVFSPFGYSSYEMPDLTDCFSYMSQEQLCNWILTSALYVDKTKDMEWARGRESVFKECLISMKNRDSMEKDYNGIMKIDSCRCASGQEITTYDSLDSSLGQAKENLYIAVKCWSSYLALETLFLVINRWDEAKESSEHAGICAGTITSYYREDISYIPAIFDGNDRSAIIPAIEAFVYPHQFGREDVFNEDGKYSKLIKVLKCHINTVLRPGVCLFPDGGWKLSANSINSWMSKIFICEYVAEYILKIVHNYKACDLAHADWWRVGCPSNPGIDQIIDAQQEESGFHYPRGVTSALWIIEKQKDK